MQYRLVMVGGRGEPQLPGGAAETLRRAVLSAGLDVGLCASPPHMPTKHPSMSPASGEKKRKVTTRNKRKTTARLQATARVLSTSAVGEAEL